MNTLVGLNRLLSKNPKKKIIMELSVLLYCRIAKYSFLSFNAAYKASISWSIGYLVYACMLEAQIYKKSKAIIKKSLFSSI